MSNSSPVLGGVAGVINFVSEQPVNAAPRSLFSFPVFTDADGNFNGGDLIFSGHLAEDSLGIFNEGTAAGQIAVTGSNIRFGNIIFASFTGGAAGTPLVVTFNPSATAVAIEALIQNLTYSNSSDTPTRDRDLILTIHDAAGAAAIAPISFAAVTGLENPFDGVDVGFNCAPTFADLDGDGDLDALIGRDGGTFNYYRNTTPVMSTQSFAEQTGAANLFDGADVGFNRPRSFSSTTAL